MDYSYDYVEIRINWNWIVECRMQYGISCSCRRPLSIGQTRRCSRAKDESREYYLDMNTNTVSVDDATEWIGMTSIGDCYTIHGELYYCCTLCAAFVVVVAFEDWHLAVDL